MKYFFLILPLLWICTSHVVYAQSKNNARLDSIKTSQQLRRDSLALVREQLAEKRKEDSRIRQQLLLSKRKKIIPPISQQFGIGYRYASDGWTIFANRGFIKTDNPDNIHTFSIWLELAEKKHPLEFKSSNENFTTLNPNEPRPVSYKYGKINNFYPLRLGIENSKPFTGKLDKKTVVINWTYGAGLAFGFLKPYYLDIIVPEGSLLVRKTEKYSEENKIYFLDLNDEGTIIGGSTFTEGLTEVKLIPGISLRSGFNFDYSANKKTFLGVEIGASLELYTKQVDIMALAKNRPYFINIYADFRFGKRWAIKNYNYEVEAF